MCKGGIKYKNAYKKNWQPHIENDLHHSEILLAAKALCTCHAGEL